MGVLRSVDDTIAWVIAYSTSPVLGLIGTALYIWSSYTPFIVLAIANLVVWVLSRCGINSSTMWRADDQTVLITGGARGVGFELALTMASKGSRVAILDVVVPETVPDNCMALKCDVSDEQQVNNAVCRIQQEFGPISILINMAGIINGRKITNLTAKQIRKNFDVNVLAHFWTVRAVLPDMISANRGQIVTMASALGFSGCPRAGDYCAAKAALISFHEALRYELIRHDGIKTILVCAGAISTGMFDGVRYRVPYLTPVLTPKEVSDRIVYALESNRNRTIYMPLYVHFMPLLRLLPDFVSDWVHEITGANTAMDYWKGRK
ncbi:hypothetical protein BZG36_04139 [Bifiguratus adelaidae]|uniref:Short-chain dehydrogenase/reductase 3 n=1 Tax=Bifiguratus adelaidae TaxID=1938954 RepID=A0A261XVZ1_9FUNG|nr:hypothetical protein BZG36_04139 [Bifiguratus adelaidae]